MASAQQYLTIFIGHADGAAVLEELQGQFYDNQIFRAGQPDVSSFNLGAREVVAFIHRKLAVAQNGDPNEEQELI